MKAVIYCFSGTGNTRIVSDMVARELGKKNIETDVFSFDYKSYSNTEYPSPSDYDIVGMKLAFDKGITSHDAYMSCSSFDKQSFKSFPISILVPEASKHYDKVDVAIEITASVCGKMVKKSLIDKANIRFRF